MNKIYYKKIEDYKDYIAFKDICNNISYMSENDFNNKYMIITATENTSMSRLTLGEVYIEDNTLYIGLKKVHLSKKFNEDNNGICIIIDNSMKSDNIEVFKTIDDKNVMTRYKNIKTLPKEYTIEQAMLDNCIIINQKEMKNYNDDKLDEFINDINNNLDAEVRIIYYESENEIQIIDIRYIKSEKKYKVCIDNTRQDEDDTLANMTYNYYEYTSIEKLEDINGLNIYKLFNNESNEELYLEIYR